MTNSLYGKFFAILPETIPTLQALHGAQQLKKSSPKGHIQVQGPLSRYETLSWGGTSYESIARQIDDALTGSSESVTLHINSPGGEIDGCYELCEKIRSAKAVKPIYAKISGYGCSAAYWIASACTEISATPTSLVGSVGVMAVIPSRTDGTHFFISSQTPHKNQDPQTETGASEIQKQIDILCDVFMEEIAKNRNISLETVKESYGKGSVFVGQKALEAGLIDKIETMEVSLLEIENRERERIMGLIDLNPNLSDLKRYITQGIEAPQAALEMLKKKGKEADPLDSLLPNMELDRNETSQLMALAKKFGVV